MADFRALIDKELKVAKSVFGTAIAFDRVRIYRRGFTPFQAKGTAVTPNGSLYFRAEDHRDDFTNDWIGAAWLVHELTHVWQYQTGVNVILRGIFERTYEYGALDRTKPLVNYKLEQQAAIVEDYYRLRNNIAPWRGTGKMEDYKAVIPFLPAGG